MKFAPLLALLVMMCVPDALRAQLTEGTIVGTVTDISGAVVSGAKVTVKNA